MLGHAIDTPQVATVRNGNAERVNNLFFLISFQSRPPSKCGILLAMPDNLLKKSKLQGPFKKVRMQGARFLINEA